MHFVFLAAWIVAVCLADSCSAIFANIGKEVPVERLLENLERYVEAHPAEGHGYYLLGRVHSMAFAKRAEVIRIVEPKWHEPLDHHENEFKFSPYDRVQVELKSPFEGDRLPEAARDHLIKSIDNYRMAVALNAGSPDEDEKFYDERFYRLGLAWMLEMGAQWAGQLGKPPAIGESPPEDNEANGRGRQLLERIAQAGADERGGLLRQLQSALPAGMSVVAMAAASPDERPEIRAAASSALKHYWQGLALAVYRETYAAAIVNDLDAESTYWGNEREDLVSYEAAKAIERLLAARESLTDEEQAELAEIRKNIEHFKALPQWITPIVVASRTDASLDDLVDPRRTVPFDLDGTGRGHSWPWVKPDTGILVWDPEETGHIASGRQLFGSVTWWLFWDHGYAALAALDDDGNGALTGRELAGIAIWHDRNADGASDPGEVQSARRAGIVRISVKCRRSERGVLSNHFGVEFESGDVRPTFDWTPTSIPRSQSPSN
jgi:hypothetical protein